MLRLPPHRLFPRDAEPGEVLVDRRLVFRPAARRVDVLDAQQQPPAGGARHVEIEQRRQRMAEMQIAVRARARSGKRVAWLDLAVILASRLHARRDSRMTHFLHTEPICKPASRGSSPPIRGSRRSPRRPAPSACAGARPAYAGLCAIVCGQQLSTASAAAIRDRLFAAFDPFHHDSVRPRAHRQARAARPLARRRSSRSRKSARRSRKGTSISTPSATWRPTHAHAALTALHGIGPWTADIYLLFCLGHADAWPAGDLAVQEAARIAFGLRKRPDAKAHGQARRSLAAVARRGGASALGLLSRGEEARGACRCSRPTMKPARRAEEEESERATMATAELDGPRLEPRSGTAQAARRVPARLWRRRQRPDRHRPRLAGPAAGRRVRVAARAASRAGRRRVGREWFPLTFRDPDERWDGVNTAAPGLERFLDAELARRKLPPSALALVGFSQGTMMALHVGLAPRRRAGRDRRLFRHAGAAGQCRARQRSRARSSQRPPVLLVHGDQDELIPVQALFHARAGARRARKCRSNGTSRRASATASTRKACATAANSSPAALAAR